MRPHLAAAAPAAACRRTRRQTNSAPFLCFTSRPSLAIFYLGIPCRLWTTHGSGALRFDSGSGWKALQAGTVAAVGPEPAFCYTGCLQLGLGRLLPCRGREALLQGRGAMAWRLWGAVPLASSESGRLDQSALLRWLAGAQAGRGCKRRAAHEML